MEVITNKTMEAITTREEEAEAEVMVEEEDDEEGLTGLTVITKEEKPQTRPRRMTLRLNAGDATRWDTLCTLSYTTKRRNKSNGNTRRRCIIYAQSGIPQ